MRLVDINMCDACWLLASGMDPTEQRSTDKITNKLTLKILSKQGLYFGGTTGKVPKVRGIRKL